MAPDIVANVVAAASPERVARAEKRLAASSNQIATVRFREDIGHVAAQASPSDDLLLDVLTEADPEKSSAAFGKLTSIDGPLSVSSTVPVLAKLESVLLANALESIMPKNSGSLYGDDKSGNFWRGQQIAVMSDELAERQVLGLSGAVKSKNLPLSEGAALISGFENGKRIRAFAYSDPET